MLQLDSIFHLFFLTLDGGSASSFYLMPYMISEQLHFLLIGKCVMEGKEGTIIAVTMYPATDNINLVNFGLADDIRGIAQTFGDRDQLTNRAAHRLGIMWHTTLIYQAAMT